MERVGLYAEGFTILKALGMLRLDFDEMYFAEKTFCSTRCLRVLFTFIITLSKFL